MKKIAIIATAACLLCTLFLGACSFFTIQGSGNIVQETRDVHNFKNISLSGAGKLNISQGFEESLTIETDDNLMEFIETKVEDGTLNIDTSDGVILNPSKGIDYNVHVKDINRIAVSGSSKVYARSIYPADGFSIKISGSARVEIDEITAGNIMINVSGSAYVNIAGNTDMLDIKISGKGTHNSIDLMSKNANVDISGSGDIAMWVTESLRVEISGHGDVVYYGNPTVNLDLSGSGSVVPMGPRK